jgi:hypothetical protein
LGHFLQKSGDFLISDDFEGFKPLKSANTKIFFAILVFLYYFQPLMSKNSIFIILNDFSSNCPLFGMFEKEKIQFFGNISKRKPIKNRGKIIYYLLFLNDKKGWVVGLPVGQDPWG